MVRIRPPQPGDTTVYPLSRFTSDDKRPIVCTVQETFLLENTKSKRTYACVYDENMLKGLIQELRYNQRHENDNLIVIHGGEGTGKSNLALYLAYMIDSTFSVSNIVYDMAELRERLGQLPDGATIVMDEAGNIAFNRDFQNKEQKEFIKLLMVIRQKRFNFIMVLPHINNLDVYIRENRVKYVLYVYTRAGGMVRGYYRLRKPAPLKEFDNTDRYFQLIGDGRFKRMTDHPEMAEIVASYRKLKDAFIERALSGKGDSTADNFHRTLYLLYRELRDRNVPNPYDILMKETGMKYNSLANIVNAEKKRRENDIKTEDR